MRTPAITGVLFALSVACCVALTGPLLLFNPWFVHLEQVRNGADQRLGTDRATLDRVTGTILRELFTGGDFVVLVPGRGVLLDAAERSHMQDVGGLVRTLALLDLGSLVVLGASALALRSERRRRGRLLLLAGGVIGCAALLVGIVFAVGFDAAFLAFHRLFFREGTFLFPPGSNLIRLFPEGFWFEASLAAGATILISATLAALVGLWQLRRAEPGQG
jgi:integral membrane protein (TIGR01906 family)